MNRIKQGHVPIYRKLFEEYEQKIIKQEFKPGSKIDSINRMMDRHGVSRETAKRVLQMLADSGLVIKQAGKGTFIRWGESLQKAWAMVVPFYSTNIEQLVVDLQTEAKNLGRSFQYFLHYNNANEEMRVVGSLIQQGYEGIIVVPNYDETQTADFYRNLVVGNAKIVLADYTMAGSYFNYVIQSYDLGVKRAVDYLGTQKQGNILMLGSERWQGKNLVFDLMLDTLQLLVAERFKNKQVFVVQHMSRLTADYLTERNITGVLSANDIESIRLLGRLTQWGFRVPEDINLVSYGNTELTRYAVPAITAIDCNYRRMASDIAQQLINDKKRQKDQVVIQPTLVLRNT